MRHHFEHIRIPLSEQAFLRFFIKIPVKKEFRSRDPLRLRLLPERCVILCKRRRLIGIGKEHAENAHGQQPQELPAEKGQFKDKTLPFVPFHHPP